MSKAYSITSEHTSFIAIEERDDKNDSLTPSIEVILKRDVDSSSIDILPYMEFTASDDIKKPNSEIYLKDIVNEIYLSFDDLSNEEKDELSEILLENEKIIYDQFSATDSTRLKYGHLLLKDYSRRSMFKKAAEIGKKTFDDSIAELDCLCEDSYKDATLILQEIRSELTVGLNEISQDEIFNVIHKELVTDPRYNNETLEIESEQECLERLVDLNENVEIIDSIDSDYLQISPHLSGIF